MKVVVKFRTMLNVVWGTKVEGREAFAFVRGFPATFFLTERRAIVVGEFIEKQGWLQKKAYHRVIFEAGLDHLKEYKSQINPKKRVLTGYLSFHPHNQLGEGALIQFMRLRPEINRTIENHINGLSIKTPVEDSGIILVDSIAPPPQQWLNKRFGTKGGESRILYK